MGHKWLFFINIYVLTQLEVLCELQPACRICKCKSLKDRSVFTDCSNKGLKDVPMFPPKVSKIDFSGNHLTVFPKSIRFPPKLVYLDMSENKINRFQNDSFETLLFLQELYLQSNKLFYNYKTFQPNLFINLKCMKILNLKNNNPEQKQYAYFTLPNELYYPDFTLQDLYSLEQLHLDGIKGKSFGVGFKQLKNLSMMDLSGINGNCNLGVIKSHLFRNVPYLRVLNISQCNTRRIQKGTFGHMLHLRELDISYNEDLTFAVAENITYDLQFTDIRILKLKKIHNSCGIGTQLFKQDIEYLQNTSLEEIYIDSNRLELFQKEMFKFIPRNLSFVSFGDNKFVMYSDYFNGPGPSYLKNLRILNASHQSSSYDPWTILNDEYVAKDFESINFDASDFDFYNFEFCDFYPRCTCENQKRPELKDIRPENIRKPLDLERSQVCILLELPPKLQYIHFNQGVMKFVIPALIFLRDNDVKYVNISGNVLYKWKGPISNLNKIEIFDLSNCFCFEINPDFFFYLGSLKELYISNNLLGLTLYKDENGEIFQNLTNLRVLDLSQNRITALPENLFRGLLKLCVLDLSGNMIGAWTFRIDKMRLIEFIDLSHNKMFYLEKKITIELDTIAHAHLVNISLYGNILLCKCEYLEFLRWANERQHVRLVGLNEYVCELQNGTKSSFKHLGNIFSQLDLECSSKLGLIIGSLCGILISVCIVIVGIVYRYRWKLRYLYYIARNKYQGYQHIQTGEADGYEYDVFVSYAEEDGCFVYNDLRNNLELAEENKVSLCIHGRDFMPGLDIAANITKAINSSRKTVIVLSRNFLRSEWCMYEFNMARMESIYNRQGKNVMFIIFYETIPASDLPMTMLELIESNSYIEYPNDPHGNVVFWRKIKEAVTNY